MNLPEKLVYLQKKMDSSKFDIDYHGRKQTIHLLEISILNEKLESFTGSDKSLDESAVETLIESAKKSLHYHEEILDEAMINYNCFSSAFLELKSELNPS